MEFVMRCAGVLRRYGQALGPYLILEMLLPGGSLFALLLYLYQRRRMLVEIGSHRSASR